MSFSKKIPIIHLSILRKSESFGPSASAVNTAHLALKHKTASYGFGLAHILIMISFWADKALHQTEWRKNNLMRFIRTVKKG